MFGPMMMKGFFGGGSGGVPGGGPGRGFGPGSGPRRGPRGRRMFEKGDLKYVILDLISEKPSHGYEVIQALEEKSRGLYSPSPGSVYPTLQLLEDLGHVSVEQRDGKKVYSITDEGQKFLEENRSQVDDIWSRVGGGWDPEMISEMHEIRHEVMGLGKRFRREMHEGRLDRDKLSRVREVISSAARQIEDILDESGDAEGNASGETGDDTGAGTNV